MYFNDLTTGLYVNYPVRSRSLSKKISKKDKKAILFVLT